MDRAPQPMDEIWKSRWRVGRKRGERWRRNSIRSGIFFYTTHNVHTPPEQIKCAATEDSTFTLRHDHQLTNLKGHVRVKCAHTHTKHVARVQHPHPASTGQTAQVAADSVAHNAERPFHSHRFYFGINFIYTFIFSAGYTSSSHSACVHDFIGSLFWISFHVFLPPFSLSLSHSGQEWFLYFYVCFPAL